MGHAIKGYRGARLAVLGGLAVLATSAAWAADAGFVTRIVGDVKLVKDGGKLAPFSRVARDERLRVSEGGQLQLVYQANGRQETWSGPCTVTAGLQEGTGEKCSAPTVKQLPPAVLAVVLRSPDAMADMKGSAGMIRMKAAPNFDAVRKMRETYQAMRVATPANDVTPELYLLARQRELGMDDAAQATLRQINEIQPGAAQAKP